MTERMDEATRLRWVQTLGFAAASLRGDRAYMARIMGGDYKKASAYQQIETHEQTLAEIADFVKRNPTAK